MAPGCFTATTPSYKLDDIPLPSTPAPVYAALSPVKQWRPAVIDTSDSFEILEQTIFKQKRLARAKKPLDMRMKVLLKRTFDLVCEIMDRENGFNESTPADDHDDSQQDMLELCDHDRSASLDLETYLAETEHFNSQRAVEYEITLQVDEDFFLAKTLNDDDGVEQCYVVSGHRKTKRNLSDDEDDEDDRDEDYELAITRLPATQHTNHERRSWNKKQRLGY